MKNVVLTGDRPTGRLHLGHYVGSLKRRIELQNKGEYEKMFIMIADAQALTDNSGNPQKVRDNVIEVMLDYLSVGLDPSKVTFLVQSEIKALPELTCYYMNLVSLARVLRNPTVKSEIKLRGFDKDDKGVPSGFANYPISQAADITAFKANVIPVGEDQLPMIEQTREIVRSFNSTYNTESLVIPNAVLPENEMCNRLPGTDGNAKMSKSLGNCIYLADTKEEVKKKVMSMFTDPNHLKIEDPGKVEGNMVFTYLDVFATDNHFKEYFKNEETGVVEYNNLDELKEHYKRGGLGDMKIKKFLNYVLEDLLEPIRERRNYYEQRIEEVVDILKEGTKEANEYANVTLSEVKNAMGINYFEDDQFLKEQLKKYE